MPKKLEEWVKKFKNESEAIRYIRQKTGFSERHIRRFLKGYKTQKYTTALKLALATGLPVEEFLYIPINLNPSSKKQSVNEEESLTVEVKR